MSNVCDRYDPDCIACQPVAMDVKTGKELPLSHPICVALRKGFKLLPLGEREKIWRVWYQNSRAPEDLRAAGRFMSVFDKAMGKRPS